MCEVAIDARLTIYRLAQFRLEVGERVPAESAESFRTEKVFEVVKDGSSCTASFRSEIREDLLFVELSKCFPGDSGIGLFFAAT